MKKLLFLFFSCLVVLVTYNSDCKAQAYYVSTANRGLYKIDLLSCNATLIGFTGSTMIDIAICADYKLYGTNGQYIFEIDTSDASQDTIGTINNVALSAGLVCDNAGNLLSVSGYDSLYQVNRFTGQYVLLGYVGYTVSGDLTFYNDTLYLSAIADTLIKISLPIVSAQVIGTMNASNVWALNTICLDGNEIMVASGLTITHSNLYLADPFTANLTPLCDSIIPGQIYGGASINDMSNSKWCITSDVAGINSNNEISYVFPNPFVDFITIETSTPMSCEIILYDILSRKLLQETFTNSITLNTEQLAKGIYIYEVRSKNGVMKNGKVMKQ